MGMILSIGLAFFFVSTLSLAAITVSGVSRDVPSSWSAERMKLSHSTGVTYFSMAVAYFGIS